MKSKISFFNKTAFKKDVTRFAPIWILYTVCMILGVVMLFQDSVNGYIFQRSLCSLPQSMNVINFCYAVIVAQLLFGDLYSSRMCNALHALPLRRECWFGTHVAAGLSFSLVPTLIGMLLAALLNALGDSTMPGGWQLPWLNLLAMNLQYLFYFGLAVLCAMLVGNRLAQGLVYGIVNFTSVILYWLVDTLITPLYYGLQTDQEPFLRLAPVVYGSEVAYMDMEYLYDDTPEEHIIGAQFTVESEGWIYIAICAALGIAFLVAALLLYRRRRLEAAGDFMAVRYLEPVFMVAFPLISGGVMYFFTNDMLGAGGVVFLIAGFVIGYIAGRMLLERTIRVFSKKNLLGFFALAAAFTAAFFLMRSDPLGWVEWIPEAEEISQVEVCTGYYYYDDYYADSNRSVTLQTPEEIRQALRVHEIGLADRSVMERAAEQNDYEKAAEVEPGESETADVRWEARDGDYLSPEGIILKYQMKDGSTRLRKYVIDAQGEAGEILIPYFSSMKMLFPDSLKLPDRSRETIAARTLQVRVDDGWGGNQIIESKELIAQLLEAIEADCAAGRMAQDYDFRLYSDSEYTYWIAFDMGEISNPICSYSDCENINEFLCSIGIPHRSMTESPEIKH